MRQYLEGYEFRVVTDHLSLKWLNSIDNPTGRLARWALELQQYRFSIEYRKGKQNIIADALSRQPAAEIHLAHAQPARPQDWHHKQMEKVHKQPELHPDYTILDGKLYRHFSNDINEDDSTPWKLCVPTDRRRQVLTESHDSVTGGHMGSRKTLKKIASRYYWPGMTRDVARYVQHCETCQRYKISQQQPAGKMLTRLPDEPWSQLCADFIGPLPRTRHGNTMLLVFFDNFSKWVELIPLRKATAEGVVKALRERIVARYGIPKILITDNGPQFTSRTLKKYLENVGVSQQFTAPYTPQENSTERANRTIKMIIAKYSGEHHNRWDELLPEVMLAMNTSESESSGYTPAFLTQGRSPRLPKALYDEEILGTGARRVDPNVRAKELKELFEIVKRNLKKASTKQQYHYNLRRRQWAPKIGDQILVRQHPLSKAVENFTAKLAPKFGGPYVVTGFVSPVIVQLRAVGSNDRRTAHLNELKPYYPNNISFSSISRRLNKPKEGRDSGEMETNQEKFERTRAKFKRNIERERQKVRKTIFLDEEAPSTSTGRSRGHRTPSNTPRNHCSSARPSPGRRPRKVNRVRNFRMTVVTPVSEVLGETSSRRTETPTFTKNNVDVEEEIIHVSEDEEIAPPPPPLRTSDQSPKEYLTEEDIPGQIPPSPIWDELVCPFDELDMDDPMIEEFCRTFDGMDDTTIDRRPPPPPSPASSVSSVDWESDDFRPPTPPKRRGFASFEVRDQQYTYLGMQCYEREWKARILIPKRTHTPPILDHPGAAQPSKIPHMPESRRVDVPKNDSYEWQLNRHNAPLPSPPTTSQIPSPPPVIRPTSPPPTSPISTMTQLTSDNPKWEELPIEVQHMISQRLKDFPTARARFRTDIYGYQYRITRKGDGTIHITRL